MSVKDSLQIFIVTYNRLEHLKNTLNQILGETSPIKDYDITVLDNNSTDGTYEYLLEEIKLHSNLKVIKNKYNIGAAGNLIKPYEIATKDYIWVLCDDDYYYFNHWADIETEINKGTDVICVARSVFNENFKDDCLENILVQLSFTPAGIFKLSKMNNTIMRNMYETTYCLFPYMCYLLEYINSGGRNIYVSKNEIVKNGTLVRDKHIDISYTRGSDLTTITSRSKNMSWDVGWINICNLIKDVDLRNKCVDAGINRKNKSIYDVLKENLKMTSKNDVAFICNVGDVLSNILLRKSKKGLLKTTFHLIKYILFRNSTKNKTYVRKFINILGIKISYKKYSPYILNYKGLLGINKECVDKMIANFKPKKRKTIKNMVLSMTSYPERMKDVHYAIFSILNQSIQPEKFILWLAKEEFPNGENDIPQTVLQFKKFGLEIKFTDAIRSFKKIVPALKEYPHSILVSADDDIYYQNDWLKNLYESYKKDPTKIYAHRIHEVGIKNNQILPYKEWNKCILTKNSSFLNFPTSVGGILYPPDVFSEEAINVEHFKNLCPNQDDVWVWVMAILNNKYFINPKCPVNNNLIYVNPQRELGDSGESTLGQTNCLCNENDKQIQNVVDFYKLMNKLLAK